MKYCSAASKEHEGRVVHSEFADCPYLTRFLSSILREHDLRLAEFARVCVKIFLKFCEVLNRLLSFIFPNPELSCCAMTLCAARDPIWEYHLIAAHVSRWGMGRVCSIQNVTFYERCIRISYLETFTT